MKLLERLKVFILAEFNLLQPDVKTEITVYELRNGDLKVYLPNIESRAAAREMCEILVKSASIVAIKAGLNMIVGEQKKAGE